MSKSNASKYYQNSFSFDGQVNLRAYFDRVLKGQPKVYETPFAKGESMSVALTEWKEVLSSIKDEWPSLWDYEEDLAKKVGPMSVMFPLEDRMPDIESYYCSILSEQSPIHHSAVSAVVNEFSRIRGLEVRNQFRTVSKMKQSTNSGSPYFKKRRLVVNDTVPCTVWPSDTQVYQDLNGSPTLNASAVLGWRGQEGGPKRSDVKQRTVWMFPFSVNVRELQVYQPLIECVQKFNIVPAWVSMESVDKRVTDLFDTKSDNDLVVCTDFSAFDQHFNPMLQNSAREILSKILGPRNHEGADWLENVFPIKYMIPLAYGVDKVKFGKHGMGSGSGGTNADETLAHRSLQYEAAILNGAELNPNSQCLGDDGILSYPGITVEDVVKAYTSHGLDMNPDKQYAAIQDCIYLRRWHHSKYRVNGICVGVYSTCRALGRLRYLERYQNPEFWDSKAVALRQLSILENVKYHPLAAKFVDFCMVRDKYRLGIDIPGFLDNIESVAAEYIENMPDLLGYTKTLQGVDLVGGIKNWWIVQYLKEKKSRKSKYNRE